MAERGTPDRTKLRALSDNPRASLLDDLIEAQADIIGSAEASVVAEVERLFRDLEAAITEGTAPLIVDEARISRLNAAVKQAQEQAAEVVRQVEALLAAQRREYRSPEVLPP